MIFSYVQHRLQIQTSPDTCQKEQRMKSFDGKPHKIIATEQDPQQST